MNTTENQTVTKRRGRPIVATATRILRRDVKTGKILGKGRIKNGLEIEEIVVHRSFDSGNYVEGQTPVVSRKNVIFHTKNKEVPVAKINVVVTEPVEMPVVVEQVAVGENVVA